MPFRPQSSSVNMGLLLEFKVVFPGEEPRPVKEYLSGGTKSIILKIATFFLGFKAFNSKYNDNRELLRTLFGPENNGFANDIYSTIRTLEQTGKKVGIINT
jgi:hypothetical protein